MSRIATCEPMARTKDTRAVDQERELAGILSQLPAPAVADLFRSAHLRLGRSRAAEEDEPSIRRLVAA